MKDEISFGLQVTSVAAGEYFSIVATASGRVYGWGDANSGQLGQKISLLLHDGACATKATLQSASGGHFCSGSVLTTELLLLDCTSLLLHC